MAECVRNCCGVVKNVPLYERIFWLTDHMLPQDTETVSDKLLDDYNRFVFEGLGEQVKRKRLEFGLTQGEFGKLYGVSKNTVRRWENGSVRMSWKMWEMIFICR